MSTVNSDIENFNKYIKDNVGGLKARGDRTDYSMIILLKPYRVSSDGEFLRYIKTKRYQYNGGYNISTDKLMTSALSKSEIIGKDNKWNSMSPEQEQIISLASVFKKLKYDNIKLAKNFQTSTSGKGKGKGKGHKQNGKQSQYGKGKEEWKKQEPKDGEANTNKFNEKTYFRCPTHQAWTIHRPEECKLKTEQTKPPSSVQSEPTQY